MVKIMYYLKKRTNVQNACIMFDSFVSMTRIRIAKGELRPLITEAMKKPRIDWTLAVSQTAAFNVMMVRQVEHHYKMPCDSVLSNTRDGWAAITLPWHSADDLMNFMFKVDREIVHVSITTTNDKSPQLFARILYKLCANFQALWQTVEIGGVSLKQGEHLAALLYHITGDSVAALATLDEAKERNGLQ